MKAKDIKIMRGGGSGGNGNSCSLSGSVLIKSKDKKKELGKRIHHGWFEKDGDLVRICHNIDEKCISNECTPPPQKQMGDWEKELYKLYTKDTDDWNYWKMWVGKIISLQKHEQYETAYNDACKRFRVREQTLLSLQKQELREKVRNLKHSKYLCGNCDTNKLLDKVLDLLK